MKESSPNLELTAPNSVESLLPDSGFPWWWIVLILAVVIGIIFAIRRKSAAINPLQFRHTAFTEAAAALSQIQTSDIRTTAVQASLILRKYLSIAAGDPALFETHEEFISRQDSLKTLSAEARSAAEAGFTRLAALKYSPDSPSMDEAEIIADSRKILETLHQGFIA